MCKVSTKVDHFISLLLGFLIFNSSFCIFGRTMGSTSFVELFVAKALHEDLGTISSLLMFVDPHVAFVMLSLYYAQRSCYLLRTMFPSPSIF
jgi:hypothetical protein